VRGVAGAPGGERGWTKTRWSLLKGGIRRVRCAAVSSAEGFSVALQNCCLSVCASVASPHPHLKLLNPPKVAEDQPPVRRHQVLPAAVLVDPGADVEGANVGRRGDVAGRAVGAPGHAMGWRVCGWWGAVKMRWRWRRGASAAY
jgi:hypothetical protein